MPCVSDYAVIPGRRQTFPPSHTREPGMESIALRLFLYIGMILGVTATSGCGQKGETVPLFPVQGEVTYRGKAATGAWGGSSSD